jgi:hypothetical protein
MTNREIVSKTLDRAASIISDYLETGRPRDAHATVNQLIEVLDNQQLAAALERMSQGLE